MSGEIPSFRSEDSDTYATSGGVYMTRVYAKPINYQAADGSWEPIDDSLVPSAGGFTNTADADRVSLPGSLASGPVQMNHGNNWVSMQIQGASGTAAVSGATATYAQALPGVNASYVADPGMLKESLSLSGPSVAPITVIVTVSGGLHVVVSHGSLLVENDQGAAQFVIPSPFMAQEDQLAAPAPDPSELGNVAVSAAPVAGGTKVTYTPDQQWLSAPGRQFPVIFDPTLISTVGSGESCSILQYSPNTSNPYCGYGTYNWAGYWSGGPGLLRSMIGFRSGLGIPQDAQILGASLNFNVNWSDGTSVPFDIYPMTTAFLGGAATWNDYDGAHPWTTPGGDFDDSDLAGSGTVSSTGMVSAGLTSVVQDWVDGSNTLPQLMITPPSGYEGSFFEFSNGNGGTTNPYLQIYYAPRLGAPRGATIDTTHLTDRMDLGVNVANGNLLLSNTDLSINGTGLDETVQRTYNNLSAFDGADGAGWGWVAGGQNAVIASYVGGAVDLFEPDGSAYVFTDPTNTGDYSAPPGIDATLCSAWSAGGCPGLPAADDFQLTFPTGEKWEFAAYEVARQVADIDNNGNQITDSYACSTCSYHELSQSNDTHGRATTFSYSSQQLAGLNLLSGMTDNAGSRSTSYGYNGSGELTGYTDALGDATSYAYDSNGNLTQVTDPDGEITELAHDSSGRVTSITRVTNNSTMAGDTTTYAYYAPATAPIECTVPNGPSGIYGWYGETVETDPNGNQTTYCYDTHDRVFETFDAYGYHSEQSYDGDDNLIAATDPLGNESQSEFDNSGTTCELPAASIAPLALPGLSTSPATGTYGYDGSGCPSTTAGWEPATSTDPQGNTISYSYDANGNLASETLPLAGSPQIITHDVLTNQCTAPATCYGLMDYSKDADGHETTYSYYTSGTNAGDVKTVTPASPLGAATDAYDADSRVISETDGKDQTTTFTYDALDRLTKETHPDGSTTTYTYDADGNLLKGVDSSTGTSTYTYDLKNRLTSEVSPGVANNYTYDGDDNLISLTDGGGTVTYGYDKDDRVTSVKEPNAPSAIGFSYDPDSRLICTNYPNGVVVQDSYDDASNLLSTKAANGTSAACNMLSSTGTPNGNVFASYVYTYNVDGTDTSLRQTLSVNSGVPFYYSYNGLNRLTEWNGGNLPGPLYYTYDPAGNVTQMDKLTGSTITATNYTYNAANEITNSSYSYDADGNLLTRPDAGGTTSFGYNSRSQTTSIDPDGLGGQALAYLGDGQSGPTQIGNGPDGGTAPTLQNNALGISSLASGADQGQEPSVTYFTRAPNGTLLGERTPTGNYYYIEDANGSVVALTDSNGNVSNTYTYDPWGQCTSESCPAANGFGYDQGFLGEGGLYHFGDRYYDPTTGIWTQPDPDADVTDPTQGSAYVFTGDDPINNVDPTGEKYTWYIGAASAVGWGKVLVAGGSIPDVEIPILGEILELASISGEWLGENLILCGENAANAATKTLPNGKRVSKYRRYRPSCEVHIPNVFGVPILPPTFNAVKNTKTTISVLGSFGTP